MSLTSMIGNAANLIDPAVISAPLDPADALTDFVQDVQDPVNTTTNSGTETIVDEVVNSNLPTGSMGSSVGAIADAVTGGGSTGILDTVGNNPLSGGSITSGNGSIADDLLNGGTTGGTVGSIADGVVGGGSTTGSNTGSIIDDVISSGATGNSPIGSGIGSTVDGVVGGGSTTGSNAGSIVDEVINGGLTGGNPNSTGGSTTGGTVGSVVDGVVGGGSTTGGSIGSTVDGRGSTGGNSGSSGGNPSSTGGSTTGSNSGTTPGGSTGSTTEGTTTGGNSTSTPGGSANSGSSIASNAQNSDGNDMVTTTANQDVLDTRGGNDTVTSTLDHLKQNDSIDGGAGIDRLVITGGNAADSLSLQFATATNANNVVLIPSLAGTSIRNFESFDLSGFAGQTTLMGSSADDILISGQGRASINSGAGNDTLVGGSAADRLVGGDGNDSLTGGGGRDRLQGGTGKDTFMLTMARGSVDQISDFRRADDTLVVSLGGPNSALRQGGRSSLRLGRLAGSRFVLGSSAQDANDRFIYNPKTGILSFDADGLGGNRQFQIARLSNRGGLAAGNIVVRA